MELFIYTNPLNAKESVKKGVVQNITSFQWLTEWQDCGEFSIECLATERNNDLFALDRIIKRNDWTINQYGIIKDIISTNGKLTVRGVLDPLDMYINETTLNVSDSIDAINSLFSKMSTKANVFTIDADKTKITYSGIDTFETTWDDLRKTLIDICTRAEIGYYGTSLYNYKITQCKLIKKGLISDRLDSYYDDKLEVDSSTYYASVIVAGEGEKEDRIKVTVTNPKLSEYADMNLTPRIKYINASSIQKTYTDSAGTQQTYTLAQYTELLRQKGLSELKSCIPTIKFTFTLNDSAFKLKYIDDYVEGDRIKIVSKKYGISFIKRITKIKEVIENGQDKITLTFE